MNDDLRLLGESVNELPDPAPEFLTLALEHGCCLETDRDVDEVWYEARVVTAVSNGYGLTPSQRQAAADYFRRTVAENPGAGDGDFWSTLVLVIDRVAETPWGRAAGTAAHFDRLALAVVDDDIAWRDRYSRAIAAGADVPQTERTPILLARMQAQDLAKRVELQGRLREHAWKEALVLAARVCAGHPRRPHTHRARRRGAGRPKANSSRSSSRSGDSPADPSDPAPACRPATRHEAAFQ